MSMVLRGKLGYLEFVVISLWPPYGGWGSKYIAAELNYCISSGGPFRSSGKRITEA